MLFCMLRSLVVRVRLFVIINSRYVLSLSVLFTLISFRCCCFYVVVMFVTLFVVMFVIC